MASGNYGGYPFNKTPGAGQDWAARQQQQQQMYDPSAYVLQPQTQQVLIQPPVGGQHYIQPPYMQQQYQPPVHQQAAAPQKPATPTTPAAATTTPAAATAAAPTTAAQGTPAAAASPTSTTSASTPAAAASTPAAPSSGGAGEEAKKGADAAAAGEEGQEGAGGEEDEEIGIKLLVPNSMVGSIIGKAGQTIKELTVATNAKIHIAQSDDMSFERVVTITGLPANLARAQLTITFKIHEDSFTDVKDVESELPLEQRVSLLPIKMLVPNHVVGRLIGKSGINLKRTMAETNTFISCSKEDEFARYTGERVVSIMGSIHDQNRALTSLAFQVKQFLPTQGAQGEGYDNAAYPGGGGGGAPRVNPAFGGYYQQQQPQQRGGMGQMGGYGGGARQLRISPELQEQEESVIIYVPNGVVGSIIGKSGATVKEIANRTRCQIRVARNDEIEPNASHRPISLAGSIDSLFKAQQALFAKVAEAPPAVGGGADQALRVELTIPNDMVGRVIGKKGSQVKKITEMSGARVTINQEEANETDGTIVTVIGGIDSNLFAQHRVFEIVYYQPAEGGQQEAQA